MSLASTMVWEVRTTGDAENGGGFNPVLGGTDYSQQDAAQLALTDLASTSASSWLTLTSATGGFTAEMVGNIIYIASGTNFTSGYYEITAYTDTNTVTVDRACGATGDASGGSGKVGGAVDHPQRVLPSMVSLNRMHIKYGTYTRLGTNDYVLQTSLSLNSSGAIYFSGYKTTRNDNPIGDNRPSLDGYIDESTAVTNVVSSAHSYYSFRNLIIKRAASAGVSSSGGNFGFINCRITQNGSTGLSIAGYILTINTEIDNNGGYAYRGTDHNQLWQAFLTYVHDNSASGMGDRYANNRPTYIIVNSVFDSNSAYGIYAGKHDTASPITVISIGSIYYNNTSSGLHYANNKWCAFTGNAGLVAINNAFISNGTYGVSYAGYDNSITPTGTAPAIFDYNAYYGNGTAALNTYISGGSNDVSTDPSFTDAAGADFTLQSGSPLIGAGLDLSTFTSLSTDFNVNIGVDQTNPDGGGGGTTINAWFTGE